MPLSLEFRNARKDYCEQLNLFFLGLNSVEARSTSQEGIGPTSYQWKLMGAHYQIVYELPHYILAAEN